MNLNNNNNQVTIINNRKGKFLANYICAERREDKKVYKMAGYSERIIAIIMHRLPIYPIILLRMIFHDHIMCMS